MSKRFTLPDKPTMPIFEVKTHGAQDVPEEPVPRWCNTCRRNTMHTRWHPAAQLMCLEHTEERVDQDSFDLMRRAYADTVTYNNELRARVQELQTQLAELKAAAATEPPPEPDPEEPTL